MNGEKLAKCLVEAFGKAMTEDIAAQMLEVIDAKLEENESGADGANRKAKENFACKIYLEKTSDGKYAGRLKLTVKQITERTEETPVNLDGEQQELDFGNE